MPLQHSPIPEFSLDSLIVKGSKGGLIVDESIISCKTVDTDKNESTLEFIISLADPKAKMIEPEAQVSFKDRIYRVRGIDEQLNYVTGKEELVVYCERLWYNLLYAGQVNSTEYQSKSIRDIVTPILADTEWSLGEVESDKKMTWSIEETTVLGALQKISSTYDIQLVLEEKNKVVHYVTNPGRDRGTYFSYERGVQGMSRRVDTSSLVTRIYAKSEDGTSIKDINGGKEYLEDYTYTTEKRVAVYDFKKGISAQSMLAFLKAYIATRSRPKISYEFTVSGLIDRVAEVDRFEVLDKVFVMDKEYERSVKSRIVALEINWVNLENSKITLENKLTSLASIEADKKTDPGVITESPNQQRRIPKSPEGVEIESFGYWWGTSAWSSTKVTWPKIVQDIDGQPIKIIRYEIRLTDNDTQHTYSQIADGESDFVWFDNIKPEHNVSAKVRAVSELGVASLWSFEVGVVTQAPPALNYPPTKLTGDSIDGVIYLYWDGQIEAIGGPQPKPVHTTHVVVEQSLDGVTGWQVVGSIQGKGDRVILPIESTDYGKTFYYRAALVDGLGHLSDYNQTTSVVANSEIANTIEEAKQASDNALNELAGIKTDLQDKVNQAIVKSEVWYNNTVLRVVPPVAGWTTKPERRRPNQVTWMKTVITRADGSTSETAPVIISGEKGDSGSSAYTWIKYADDESGNGMSNSPEGKIYIGIAANKDTPQESDNPTDYAWSRLKGEQGARGAAGADGRPTYTWIKYSDNSSGSPMYDVPRISTQYIGLAVNKPTEVESSSHTDYTWSKFKGEDGVSVRSIRPFFIQVNKGAAAPAKPTGNTPNGWVETEPKWNESKDLYRTERVELTDGTVSYTNVTIVSTNAGAIGAIQQLRTTVDGKNTIYTTRSTPTSPAPKLGDLWYKLDSSGQRIVEVLIFSTPGQWKSHQMTASSVLVPGSVGSVLIQDGAITGSKVTVDNVLANNLFTDTILAGKIKSTHLSADALDGKTITGATIKTREEPYKAKTVIDPSGIRFYTSVGREKVRISDDTDHGLELYNPADAKMYPVGPAVFDNTVYALEETRLVLKGRGSNTPGTATSGSVSLETFSRCVTGRLRMTVMGDFYASNGNMTLKGEMRRHPSIPGIKSQNIVNLTGTANSSSANLMFVFDNLEPGKSYYLYLYWEVPRNDTATIRNGVVCVDHI